MCNICQASEKNEVKKNIDGCEVILKFLDKPDVEKENTIIDILMSAFESRVSNGLVI